MTKLKRITRGDCQHVVKPRLEAALAVLEEIGLKATVGSGSYTDSQVRFTVTLRLEGADPEREDFEYACFVFGLTPAHYKARFTADGKEYELVGLKPRRVKYPVSARRVADGRPFKFTKSVLARLTAAG